LRLISLILIVFSFSAFAGKAIVEEEVYIPKFDKKLIKYISSFPELTIDHVGPNGFEVFGPKGLKEWLRQNNIEYRDLLVKKLYMKNVFSDYPTYEEITAKLQRLESPIPTYFETFFHWKV
jgi:hypothetical protein